VLDHDRLLVSYYSSHEGRTAIHFAEASVIPRDDGVSPPRPESVTVGIRGERSGEDD
jgi:hypothetical protein